MEEILSLAIPVVFVVMLVIERVLRAKKSPKVRWWLVKGIVMFVFTGVVNALVPALIASLAGPRSLLHLSWLGIIPGALLAYVLGDLVGYWIHRAMHTIPWLWRWTHQMHHSAERMDLAGMSYAHPFDTILTFTLSGFAAAMLGLSPDAAALGGFLGFASAVILHSNIKTPRWIGWLVMRPEQHGLHHERGVHAYNYANFPVWDLLFGTFRNPKDFPEHYGFWDGASSRIGAMLLGRDVGEPPPSSAHSTAERSTTREMLFAKNDRVVE